MKSLLVSHQCGTSTVNNPVNISLPLSKSLSNRRLIIDALSGIMTPRDQVARCDDTDAMIAALGTDGDCLVNVGAAGTAMRFLTAYFATRPGRTVTLDGTERMRLRPIGPLVDALRQLGAHITYLGRDGYPPLLIQGTTLEGGGVSIDAGISSQYISALLMIAPTMKLGLELTLKGELVSEPYIDMTLAMMTARGIHITRRQPDCVDHSVRVSPGLYRADTSASAVEADWSAALYWFEVTALTGRKFILNGLSDNSLQGDSRVRAIFTELGVQSEAVQGSCIETCRAEHPDMAPLVVDMTDCPDAAQTIMATCCGTGRPFTITGLSTLPLKETDRLGAMKTELAKLGFTLTVTGNDTVSWDGRHTPPCEHPVIETYNDHRMAMSIAPLAAVVGPFHISNPGVVTKSYPDFWLDLKRAGFDL